MTRIHPECPDSAAPDHSAYTDLLLRQKPEEEGHEEDEIDAGYSE